jgi:hypothetical protein
MTDKIVQRPMPAEARSSYGHCTSRVREYPITFAARLRYPTEDFMSHFLHGSRLATVVAVTFGFTMGAATVAAHDNQARQAATSDEQVAQAQSTSPSPASENDATTAPKQNSDTDTKNKTKHPPTAQMDKATPTQKPSGEKATHPPTSAMDKATPDEKSPKSSQ